MSKDLKQGDAVEQAIELWVKLEGGKVEPKLEDDSKEELVSFLRLLSTGEKPNDTKCCLVAHEAGMQAEDIMRIRDKLFGARNGNEATH
ncbi:MAG: hypothetical protein KME30_26205 [Iphinoe sp. HA4291-MV1]|nr:hypothetical protein [Iphinoe sp. HA4291-MV1]